jgi:hypothetical protein
MLIATFLTQLAIKPYPNEWEGVQQT